MRSELIAVMNFVSKNDGYEYLAVEKNDKIVYFLFAKMTDL